jgi:hypothetical protein
VAKTTQGRRVPIIEGKDPYFIVTQAGDYCGPDKGEHSSGVPAVWFLLPIARDKDVPPHARSMHHVCMPPHVFTENQDGTLTIRESIGAGIPFYWHGYLTNGVWEEA